MSLLATDKNIRVDCESTPGVTVRGDRARLKQVIVNLLDNAIKYTPRGGRIALSVRREGALGNFAYPTYMHIAPDINYLERAYDDAKHGWYSSRPFLTPVVPTIM